MKPNEIINQTISDYNLIAAKFSSTRNKLSPDLIHLAKKAGGRGKILDYGCGNGRLCRLFNPENYLGVDPSVELINIAKQQHPTYNFDLIKPCAMPKSGNFDIIFCLATIHHFPDRNSQTNLLNNFHTKLKQNGKLILTAWHLGGRKKIISVPFRDDCLIIERQIYSFDLDELKQIVGKCGFKITTANIVPRNKGIYSNIEIIAQK